MTDTPDDFTDNDELFSATPNPDASVHALRVRHGTAILLGQYINADDDGIDVAIEILLDAGATWASIIRALLDLATTYAPELYERGDRITGEVAELARALGDHDGWT